MNKTQLKKERSNVISEILEHHKETMKGLGSVGELDWNMSRAEDLAYLLGRHDMLDFLVNKEGAK